MKAHAIFTCISVAFVRRRLGKAPVPAGFLPPLVCLLLARRDELGLERTAYANGGWFITEGRLADKVDYENNSGIATTNRSKILPSLD